MSPPALPARRDWVPRPVQLAHQAFEHPRHALVQIGESRVGSDGRGIALFGGAAAVIITLR